MASSSSSLSSHAARLAAALLVALLAGCQQAPAPTSSAPAPARPAPAPSPAAPAAVAPVPKVVLPSTDFPPGPLYFCVTASARTPIDYEPRVEQLCRRHPEMGPCQYERNACRAQKGRVFTARGEEVTMAVEAEYDKAVTRVTFKGDSGSAPAKKK
ncbi:MAG: hypothetical protein U1F48_07205 [Burkholderiales bacterium]